MSNKTRELFERAHKLQPELKHEEVISLWEYDLDRDEPRGLKDGFVLISDKALTVYENSEIAIRESMENIKEFRFQAGVGCVFAEYVNKDGESFLISRASSALKTRIATAIKAANH